MYLAVPKQESIGAKMPALPIFKFHTNTIQSILDPVAAQVSAIVCAVKNNHNFYYLENPK